LRYFGGKARIATQIANYINNLGGTSLCNTSEANPNLVNQSQSILIPYTHTHTHTHTERNVNAYIEPFCGACNVASKVNIPNKILNDKHKYLIAMFQALQNGWIPPDSVTEEEYYIVKQNQDIEPYVAGFVGFACSFAGKYWGGYARGDGDRNYCMNGKNVILTKMETLKDATFTCKDFTELDFNDAVIYCDPPYKNTTPYYTKLLGEFPYNEFIKWANEENMPFKIYSISTVY
jgi:DNA adenine methylase